MVSSAKRFAQPVSSVLALTFIVTCEEIERWQFKSVPDVMRRLSGADIAQDNNARCLLTLIDGSRLNSAEIGRPRNVSIMPVARALLCMICMRTALLARINRLLC
ncbi:hypothetical protein EHW64_13510 [Erwinia psidii]|uniref:hypothetical protein n=1 Tax=Erwinia psidii TaxID=69224 RepID=UPI00226B1886|nr:hypothetical protein [Erwinia psidii]MCX8962119.1 hypothetical protein [Erwinia psidii]